MATALFADPDKRQGGTHSNLVSTLRPAWEPRNTPESPPGTADWLERAVRADVEMMR